MPRYVDATAVNVLSDGIPQLHLNNALAFQCDPTGTSIGALMKWEK